MGSAKDYIDSLKRARDAFEIVGDWPSVDRIEATLKAFRRERRARFVSKILRRLGLTRVSQSAPPQERGKVQARDDRISRDP